VPLSFLRELEISQLISGYSYMGENEHGEMMVYCEEDCDMGIVCTRMELDEIKFEIDDEFEDEEDEPFTDQFEPYDGDVELGEIEQNTDGLEEFLGYGEEEEWDEEEEDDED
jgi:hypothetical protein